ncbi:MAG: hypothetical protein JRI80_18645 [Deltaproteobacteria bacterium]|nr:hypothetical protein [Deltaproteobacteria bacterium]
MIRISPTFGWRAADFEDLSGWYQGSSDAVSPFFDYVRSASPVTTSGLRAVLSKLEGPFAVVAKKNSRIYCATDGVRSCPVFYAQEPGRFSVSNSAEALKDSWELREVNLEALLEFPMAGYVTGRETLLARLYQLQAAEFVFLCVVDSQDARSAQLQAPSLPPSWLTL